MTAVMDRVREYRRRLFRLRPEETAWAWADRCLYVHEGENPENVGPYATALTPYVREFIECFRDPSVTDVAVQKGSQTGLSMALQAGVAWHVANGRGSVLWVMPAADDAREFSEVRWQELLKGSKETVDLIPEDPKKFGLMRHRLGRNWVNFVGSNSPGKLAQRPRPVVVCDEVDKFAPASEKEAHALDLADQRTKKFSSPKRVKISTPTIAEGPIHQEYLKGDQRWYYMPCPHCGEHIRFEWSGVQFGEGKVDGKWDLDRVRRAARYECPECAGRITDSMKLRMLPMGEWRPTAKGAPGYRSYHCSSLYSPWVSCTWGNLAVRFLLDKEHFGLQGFTTGYLGEPWRVEVENVDPVSLMARREVYTAEQRERMLVVTVGVDVQDDRLEAEMVAWGRGWENWSLDYQVFEGDPGRQQVWDDLDAWLLDARDLPVYAVGVDTGGHHTQAVYGFCKPRTARRVRALKGSSVRWAPVIGARPSRNNRVRCPVWTVGTDTAKALIFAWFKRREPGAGYAHFPEQYDEERFLQLGSEELRTKRVKGYEVRYFHKTRERNEGLDARVYAYAALLTLPRNILEVMERRKALERRRSERESGDDDETKKPDAGEQSSANNRGVRVRRRGRNRGNGHGKIW